MLRAFRVEKRGIYLAQMQRQGTSALQFQVRYRVVVCLTHHRRF